MGPKILHPLGLLSEGSLALQARSLSSRPRSFVYRNQLKKSAFGCCIQPRISLCHVVLSTTSCQSSSSIQSHSAIPKTIGTTEYPPWTPPSKGFLSLLPSKWVPYAELMRLEKTGGLYGFYFPYLIGIGFAASVAPQCPAPTFVLSTSATFLIWTILLRGSVCTINDNFDREFDRQVARCRNRPIARGAVTPFQGHVWYTFQSIAAFAVVTQLPCAMECFLYAIPIHFLLSVYPLAKRVTDFPQVLLSIPLAMAILMSGAAFDMSMLTMKNAALSGASAALFVTQALWSIMLDYVNACQDSIDDIKAGVRSMAVRYQDTGLFISVLSTVQVSLMVTAGFLSGTSLVFYLIACGGNAAILTIMARTIDRGKPRICAWWFLRGSVLVGGTTVIGLFAEYSMRVHSGAEQV